MGGWRNILLLMISAAFVAASLFLLSRADSGEDRAMGVYSLLFFGGCLLVAIAEIFLNRPPTVEPDAVGRIVLRPQHGRLFLMGLAALAWGVAGWLAVRSPYAPVYVSWPLLLFGAIGAIVLLGQTLNFGARVEMDADGLADFRVLRGTIPWDDIEALNYSHDRAGRTVLGVWLRDPASYQNRLRSSRFGLFKRAIYPLQITPLSHDGTLAAILVALTMVGPPRLTRVFTDPGPTVGDGGDWDDDI